MKKLRKRFRVLEDQKPIDKGYPWMVVSNHTAKAWALASTRRRADQIVRALNRKESK